MRALPALALLVSLVLAAAAGGASPHPRLRHTVQGRKHHPNLFGTKPLPISIGASHKPANGPSGGVVVSGDNRKTRLAAFYSSASNLVPGDTNGKVDVFVWHRPRGLPGVRLNQLSGWLTRVSVDNEGQQANGDSINPSLDGSLNTIPHCVAFQSTATNLNIADTDTAWDIYVRDLRTRVTYLVSRQLRKPATNPSIDGKCRRVAFQSGGAIWVARVHGHDAPTWIAPGSHPSFSRDGTALVWVNRGVVHIMRRGNDSRVGPGFNAHVSDLEYGRWGVVFDSRRRLDPRDHDHYVDVYLRVVLARGGSRHTFLVSIVRGGDAYNGGITAYGQNRGIVVFGIREGTGSGLWYFNKHTGHADDLAYTTHGELYGIATSARANFVAFTAEQPLSPLDHTQHATVYFKALVDGQSYGPAY